MRARRGFVLLEVILGVTIFAVGVLALGRCVNNCITAELARQETDRARLALSNRMAEVEADEVSTEKTLTEKLDGSFTGLTLKQTRHAVPAKNEKGYLLTGLYEVDLEVDWVSGNEPESRSLNFYVLRDR